MGFFILFDFIGIVLILILYIAQTIVL